MNNTNETGIRWSEIEPLCMLRLLKNKLWLIIMAAITGALTASIVLNVIVTPVYQCNTIFSVMARSSSLASATSYVNTAAASEVVNIYSELLKGRFMKEIIANDLGDVDGEITAEQIGSTNLINVTVKSSSPREALLIMQSINENHSQLSEYVTSTSILTELSSPNMSATVSHSYDTKKICLISAAGCAVLVAALVFWIGISVGTVQTEEGAKNTLDAKIIAALPHEKLRKEKGKKKAARSQLNITSPVISFSYAEAVHSVAAKLEHEHDKNKKVFLFTSVSPAEGKSTLSANCSLSLATSGARVLFLDMDLRRPVQAAFFGISDEDFVSFGDLLEQGTAPDEILRNSTRIKVDSTEGRLYALLSNRSYSDMIEFLGSSLMDEVVKTAEEAFDYVIIDSPPLGFYSDSEVLSDLADGTVLVVRQDIVPAAQINDAVDSLRAGKAEFLGIVLNDMQHLSITPHHGYGYGYAYGYGSSHYGHYGYGTYGKYGSYGKYGKYGSYGKYGRYGTSSSDSSSKKSKE